MLTPANPPLERGRCPLSRRSSRCESPKSAKAHQKTQCAENCKRTLSSIRQNRLVEIPLDRAHDPRRQRRLEAIQLRHHRVREARRLVLERVQARQHDRAQAAEARVLGRRVGQRVAHRPLQVDQREPDGEAARAAEGRGGARVGRAVRDGLGERDRVDLDLQRRGHAEDAGGHGRDGHGEGAGVGFDGGDVGEDGVVVLREGWGGEEEKERTE